MTIEAGQRVPSIPVKLIDTNGVSDAESDAVLGTGLVVFFTVPGAFTPTCSTNHLPGFIANAPKMRAAGVSRIVCGTVNDHHVTKVWAETSDALGKVDFIADAKANLATALGLDKTTGDLGLRFRRSAMIIENGVVSAVYLQDEPGVTASGAPAVMLALEAMGHRADA